MNTIDVSNNIIGLKNVLNMERLTEVVDIGANPIDHPPPYKKMLEMGLCNVTGFEPQKNALDNLISNKGNHERYLPYVIGDGNNHILNVYRSSGLTSLLELDMRAIDIFRHLKPVSDLLWNENVSTIRLDDVVEIKNIDFLKIDIQGGELSVFKNSKRLLRDVVAIQTEVSFFQLYKNQPCFGEIDVELRSQGFIPHCFAMPVNTAIIAPVLLDNDPWKGLNQLGEADIVYVRDFRKIEELPSESLKHLAFVANCAYRSVDLVFMCLQELARRGDVECDSPTIYLQGGL